MSRLAVEISRVARSKVGSQEWRYDVEKDDFGKKTNKCNKFVYDVMVEAGVVPPPLVWKTRYWVFLVSRAPLAREWADPNTQIDGWAVVSDPQPGDVVAEAHDYSDATGHCGIVVGPNETVSASSLVGGNIVLNDWGFRSDNRPTFRRCTLEGSSASGPYGPHDAGVPPPAGVP
jgi:cell wall-associated NlpC family hydrolase